MRILIVGSGAKEYILAKKLKEQGRADLVFIAPSGGMISDAAAGIDIQADDVASLVDFAQANEINLTVVCDGNAISNGIAEAFEAANLMIFAPAGSAARFVTNKSVSKKFMYKLKIPTPKFAIFDRENLACDYLKNADYPVFIKTDTHQNTEGVFLCHSQREANSCVENLFFEGHKKIIIEDFIEGKEASFYIITDGYKALEAASVASYKYNLEGDTGAITKGMGAYAPAVFIDKNVKSFLFNKVINPALKEVERNSPPYVGILGVDLIMDRNEKIHIIEFNSFFNEPDISCALALIENDLIELMCSCCTGALSDDYHGIDIKNDFAMSVVLNNENKTTAEIKGLDLIDEDVEITFYNAEKKEDKLLAKPGRVLGFTKTASTLSRAKKILKENVEQVNFEGKKYRKDILKSLDD